MQLLIMSDTHVPVRARDLPSALWDEVLRADAVLHAGDWMDVALLDALESCCDHVIGCWGNNDGFDLRSRLPEVGRAELGGLAFAVVHETGPSDGRERRMDARYAGTDVLVFGHSHIPWDSLTPGGIRLLNPGSPTDRRAQPVGTYLTATVAEGCLTDVVLHPVT
ncbi:MAG: metallophosphoesterase [Actinomycetota bacterium]